MQVSLTHNIAAATCDNNKDDWTCNAAIQATAVGSSTTGMTSAGISGGADVTSTVAGTDGFGIIGRGQVRGSGVGIGSGAYLVGLRSTATGKALGAEISSYNNVASTDCTVVTATNIGDCDGLAVVARGVGTSYNSTAVKIYKFAPSLGWAEGITTNVDGIRDTAINLQDSATTGLNIAGTRTSAIVTAATAGGIKINGAINQFGAAAGAPAHLASGQLTAPALTSCGTGSPSIVGTDTAGTITTGTNATGCIITFNVAYVAAPHCVVTWQTTPAASQSYTISTTAITLTQTSASGRLVNYVCIGRSGG